VLIRKARRATLLTAFIGIVAGSTFVVFSIHGAVVGEFRRRRGPDLLRFEEPFLFWCFFFVMLLIGIAAIYHSVIQLANMVTHGPRRKQS